MGGVTTRIYVCPGETVGLVLTLITRASPTEEASLADGTVLLDSQRWDAVV